MVLWARGLLSKESRLKNSTEVSSRFIDLKLLTMDSTLAGNSNKDPGGVIMMLSSMASAPLLNTGCHLFLYSSFIPLIIFISLPEQ